MAFHGARDNVASQLTTAYVVGSGSMRLVTGDGDRFGLAPFWVTLLPPGKVDAAGRVVDPAVMVVFECTARVGDRLSVTPTGPDVSFDAGSSVMLFIMAGHITELQDAASSYVYTQATPASTWTVTHNLSRRPLVMIVDSAGSIVEGDVTHIDDYRLRIVFSTVFSGKAYLR